MWKHLLRSRNCYCGDRGQRSLRVARYIHDHHVGVPVHTKLRQGLASKTYQTLYNRGCELKKIKNQGCTKQLVWRETDRTETETEPNEPKTAAAAAAAGAAAAAAAAAKPIEPTEPKVPKCRDTEHTDRMQPWKKKGKTSKSTRNGLWR